MASSDGFPLTGALNEGSSTGRGDFDCQTTSVLGLSADTKVGHHPTPK